MKKLIPAIALLVISSLLLSVASYAWFSMNTTVTATNMQVTVKSDNTFLLISKTNSTAAAIQAEELTTVDLAVPDAEAKVYPSKPMAEGEVGVGNLFETGTAVTNFATADAFENWYTAIGVDPANGTLKTGTASALTGFSGYVVKRTVYLTIAEGANDAQNLTVKPTITAKTGETIDAVKVLVTTDDGGFETLIATDTGTEKDIKGTNTALTDATVLTVNIYIYYDGSVASVNTNNAANLDGANITLEFGVDAIPAA